MPVKKKKVKVKEKQTCGDCSRLYKDNRCYIMGTVQPDDEICGSIFSPKQETIIKPKD